LLRYLTISTYVRCYENAIDDNFQEDSAPVHLIIQHSPIAAAQDSRLAFSWVMAS